MQASKRTTKINTSVATAGSPFRSACALATILSCTWLSSFAHASAWQPSSPTSVSQTNNQAELRKLDTRVTSSGKILVIDRGSRDRVERGDRVVFRSRDGQRARGRVMQVDERTAQVRLNSTGAAQWTPAIGAQGQVQVPEERFASTQDGDANSNATQNNAPAAQETAPLWADEHPDWQNEDKEWSDDQPLLAKVRPQRPHQRPATLEARVYTSLDQILSTEDGRSDSFFRSGADIWAENPFGRGGGMNLDFELNYRNTRVPDVGDQDGTRLRVDRFSYFFGGNRFEPNRFEFGRFLQSGMPEFGVLDGASWDRRLDNGDRAGVSLGWMPEQDFRFGTGHDFQAAGYYEWIPDDLEQLSVAGGFQKSFHNGAADRDLLIGRVRYLTPGGWNFNATTWIDIYGDNETAEDAGVELTQALAYLSKRFENGERIDFTYRHSEFPDIDRQGEFLPLSTAQELADNRLDRLSMSGSKRLLDNTLLHANGGVWNDEDESGGDLEVGAEFTELLGRDSRVDLNFFGTGGSVESVLGARTAYDRLLNNGRWGAFYEIAQHHQFGFSNDIDDLLQHRIHANYDRTFKSGWNLSMYVESRFWDFETSFLLGFYLQRNF